MTTTFAKVPKTLGISDFRSSLADNLARAKKSPLIIADQRGGESYVVLSADAYNKLVEAYEDEQDSLELFQWRFQQSNATNSENTVTGYLQSRHFLGLPFSKS